jgi:hypothetical protein
MTLCAFFLNDKDIFNTRYRGNLIKALVDAGYVVDSGGVTDNLRSTLRALLSAHKATIVISSNLRANLLAILLFPHKSLIILNGLGRFRKSRKFRRMMLGLIIARNVNTLAVQNYADFRYFRKHLGGVVKLVWVAGSGGTARDIGLDSRVVVVCRREKLPLVWPSLCEFAGEFGRDVAIVGCDSLFPFDNLDAPNVRCIGYVDQSALFRFGQIFFQPDGYGEGVPHSLVDAICSDMKIFLSKKMYLQCGLHKVGATLHGHGKYYLLTMQPQVSEALSSSAINKAYVTLARAVHSM